MTGQERDQVSKITTGRHVAPRLSLRERFRRYQAAVEARYAAWATTTTDWRNFA
ncbi:hypothetical protein SEA_SONALI_40 [Arthrobacter phage Sonali]|uniref:Uncharacterized protein n=1 Tax=Arthrobacter phage Sonali TaxID=2510495 RepID=A0A411CQP1_9CAUD|nr:hypothetical protein HOV09_gp40 [Arthrobacter phage Sonali]QAY16152.1 hypothetical protein SEA_SONALI_40 [Arthrobacter phage Sonali]